MTDGIDSKPIDIDAVQPILTVINQVFHDGLLRVVEIGQTMHIMCASLDFVAPLCDVPIFRNHSGFSCESGVDQHG